MRGFGFEALEIKILCQVYGLVKGSEASDRDACKVHAKGLISTHFLSMMQVLDNHRASIVASRTRQACFVRFSYCWPIRKITVGWAANSTDANKKQLGLVSF